MQGYNVLHPMGFDAFGLPAENYALKNKLHPQKATETNIAAFKEQLAVLGFSYDWAREVITTDPQYYRWTQWIFLQMWKKGLAFAAQAPRDDAYVDDVVLPERLADLVAEKAQFQLIDLDRRFEPLAEAHHTIDLFVVANLERRLDGRAQIRQTLGLVADDPLPQCVKRHPKLIPDCHLRPLGANGSISSLRC